MPPPTASDAPKSARSNPVSAPSASSMITQTMPPITSSQFTQLPTETLLPLHVPRTIAFRCVGFNDSWRKCGNKLWLQLSCERRYFRFLLFLAGPRGFDFFLRFVRFLCGRQFAPLSRGPAGLVDLAAARDSQSVGRNIFRDRRTRGDVRAIADAHGRHQRGIAADENFVPDGRWIFVKAVVVAGDGAGPDV